MYNFPLWPSDEKAKLGGHNIKPFLKNSTYCREAISNLFARSSRKRASRSCTSVRKISSSMASAVDRVVVANGVRNITICKNTSHVDKPVYSCVRESLPRIMVAWKMDNCSFLFSCSLSFTTVVTSSVCVLQLATVLEGEAVSVCVLCSLMNTCCENSTRVVAASNLSFSAHFCFLSASF